MKLFGKLLALITLLSPLHAQPLISAGGGYWDARNCTSGAVFQLEYKFEPLWWPQLRPQITLDLTKNCSFFGGIGVGWEFPLGHGLFFIPSFEPGLYFRGNGRDLGYPLEFRSGVELCYEFCNGVRFGGEFFHISNAHLGCHNPGANAYVVFLAFPSF